MFFYHPINEGSDLCLLSTKATPSMSLSSRPYEVWVCVKKSTTATCGGEII